jgi:HEPN domain-containing protein
LSDPKVLSDTRTWLRFAQEDLDAAHASSIDERVVPRITCWHCQQSAEKAIKAILVFNELEVPYRHDLLFLLTRVPEDWSVRQTDLDLSQLTYWATSARYPGDLPDATTDDVSLSLQIADDLFQLVLDGFSNHDFNPQV